MTRTQSQKPAFTTQQLNRLAREARSAAAQAYAPYSRFPVGAAALFESGKIYRGCNVENASYGLCICAERSAIFSAIAAGERRLRYIALYTPTQKTTMPCGACRQVIREFGPDCRIVSLCAGENPVETDLATLLPESFGPENLKR